ncbi:MAG: hypothetical protein KJO82_05810 [Gammaproteobacteria bacterium]|nr:hypothetical protein [Gammaproteobacteria bacterium]NNC77957.1 hypothetical protein [Woeseiaceae bacterium]
MAFDTTVTENDLDFASRSYIQNLRNNQDFEPDLNVDGMSESLLSRFLGLLGKSH